MVQVKQFKPVEHYVRATIYGGSGVGKTVFAGTAPRPIFASAEKGLLSVLSVHGYTPHYVEIKSINDLRDLYKRLREGKHEYQTLVLDSLTEINEIIRERVEKEAKKGVMTFNEWGKVFNEVKGIIRGMQDLKMHVILICQEKEKTDEDGNVVGVFPMLNGRNAKEVAYLMDYVGYMYIDKNGDRRIIMKHSDKIISKDRSSALSPFAPLDFNEWIRKTATVQEKEGASPYDGEPLSERTQEKAVSDIEDGKPEEQAEVLGEIPSEKTEGQELDEFHAEIMQGNVEIEEDPTVDGFPPAAAPEEDKTKKNIDRLKSMKPKNQTVDENVDTEEFPF